MSNEKNDDRLSDEIAKILIKSIEDVEREEADAMLGTDSNSEASNKTDDKSEAA